MPGPSTSASPAEISSLLAGPAGTPPPGVVPNFVDPYTLDPYIWLGISLWLSISTLAVVARLGTNVYFDRKLVPEDYVIILGLVAQAGEAVCGILVAKTGFGAHIWDIRVRDFIRALYYANLNSIVYAPTIILIKVAILMQYLRIFVAIPRSNKPLFVGCWFWMVAVVIFYLIDTVLEIVQCLPREKIWNIYFQGGSCIDYVSLYKATGLFNIISDFGLLLLPLPTIIRLQCTWVKKVQIGGVFATGLLGCIASIFRTIYTWRLVHTTDISIYTWYVAFWTWAEICVGTLVFCLPAMPRFFHVVIDNLRTMSLNYLLSRGSRGSRSGTQEGHGQQEEEGQQLDHQQQQKQKKGELPAKKDKDFPHMFVSYGSWEDPDALHLRSIDSVGNRSTTPNDMELQTLEAVHQKDAYSPPI